MKADARRAATRPLLPMLLCWVAAFALACRIDASAGRSGRGDSLLDRVLGETRMAFGQGMFLEADRYFHLGVGETKRRAFSDPLTRLGEAIQPTRHVETQGAEVREIAPWLRFATRMDPHNVDAFLAAAFWVAGHGGSPDVAEGILMEAQRNNPTDYRVFREKASLLMRLGRWEDACSALEAGIKLWPGSTDPSERQAAADLTRMLDERSVLAVRGGDMKTAVEFARKALARAPDHDHLAWRIEAIERGESLDGWADKALAGLARRYTDQVEHECPRAGAHEHEHDGEHVHNHEHGPRCGHDH